MALWAGHLSPVLVLAFLRETRRAGVTGCLCRCWTLASYPILADDAGAAWADVGVRNSGDRAPVRNSFIRQARIPKQDRSARSGRTLRFRNSLIPFFPFL